MPLLAESALGLCPGVGSREQEAESSASISARADNDGAAGQLGISSVKSGIHAGP
jgi:hypothetical protein